jgi:hypothetical protein
MSHAKTISCRHQRMGNAWCEGSEITYGPRAGSDFGGERVESRLWKPRVAGTASVEVTLVEGLNS